jgi:hypothetical protein
MQEKDILAEMHRRRSNSMHFKSQQHVDYLNHQNEKIINKLMSIAKKKSTFFSKEEEPRIAHYRNPARKR